MTDIKKIKSQIDAELDSAKVVMVCAAHNYYGPSKLAKMRPATGCSKCWEIFYVHDLAAVSPDKRAERVAEIHEVITNLNRLVETGKFDYTPFLHAKVEYEKDGLPN